MPRQAPVKIIPSALNPEPVEVIAAQIKEIADAMRKINSSRLTRAAIVALIADHSRVGKRTIELVLNNLGGLESTWLKKAA